MIKASIYTILNCLFLWFTLWALWYLAIHVNTSIIDNNYTWELPLLLIEALLLTAIFYALNRELITKAISIKDQKVAALQAAVFNMGMSLPLIFIIKIGC